MVTTNSLADGSGPNFIHSGTYGAFLGDTNMGSLSQVIQTVPGQAYLLSFWLVNPQSGPGQQFSVNWNTNSSTTNQIYSISSPRRFGMAESHVCASVRRTPIPRFIPGE